MQLRLTKTGLIGAAAIAAVGAVCFAAGPIRIVRQGARELALAPGGYSYRAAPFTGIVYDRGARGFTKLAFLWHGRLHGPDLQWYASGHKSIERHYRHGLESGEHRAWYENGRVKFLKHFYAGVPQGNFYEWHPNGQLAQFVSFEQGREVVARSWTAGGKPFYNYVWRDGQRVGLEGDTFCSISKK